MIRKIIISALICFAFILFLPKENSRSWGFYGHKRINRMAVFTLPPEMVTFYKNHIEFITNHAVDPDKRRYGVEGEAPRHYIDIDHYGEHAFDSVPKFWKAAVAKYSEDTLMAYGIVPWQIEKHYYKLMNAFKDENLDRILNYSADLGHYIADAHVPLHTTENYNGQLTGQRGIHGFWESRLPELFSTRYDFFVGKAEYLDNPQLTIWKAIEGSNLQLDSVFLLEKRLSEKFGEKKYSFETKGKQTMKVYSAEFSAAYHEALTGMVEQRMRGAIKMIGDFWYTAWVDAGQPDLKVLINYTPTEEELATRKKELEEWKQQQ